MDGKLAELGRTQRWPLRALVSELDACSRELAARPPPWAPTPPQPRVPRRLSPSTARLSTPRVAAAHLLRIEMGLPGTEPRVCRVLGACDPATPRAPRRQRRFVAISTLGNEARTRGAFRKHERAKSAREDAGNVLSGNSCHATPALERDQLDYLQASAQRYCRRVLEEFAQRYLKMLTARAGSAPKGHVIKAAVCQAWATLPLGDAAARQRV